MCAAAGAVHDPLSLASARRRGRCAGGFVYSPRSIGSVRAALTSGHFALIEMIYRGVYLLATLRREELPGERREKQLDDIAKCARKAMAEAMSEEPT